MPPVILFQIMIWASSYAALHWFGPLALVGALVFWSAITFTINKGPLFLYQALNIGCIAYFLGGDILPALEAGLSGGFWSAVGFIGTLAAWGLGGALLLAGIAVLAGRGDFRSDDEKYGNHLHEHSGRRIFLNVPYAEKDLAKALGARYDGELRMWYAIDDGSACTAEMLKHWR